MHACVSQDNYVKPHALASFLFNRGLTISNMSKTTGIDGVSSRSYEDGGNSRFSNNNLTGGVETFVGCGVNVSVQSIGCAIYAETNLFDFVLWLLLLFAARWFVIFQRQTWCNDVCKFTQVLLVRS
jgi:hypothetical protein